MFEEDRRMLFKDVVCGKYGNWYKCIKGEFVIKFYFVNLFLINRLVYFFYI